MKDFYFGDYKRHTLAGVKTIQYRHLYCTHKTRTQVAVLTSGYHGPGWASFNTSSFSLACMFDGDLAHMALAKAGRHCGICKQTQCPYGKTTDYAKYAEEKYGRKLPVNFVLDVTFVDVGEKFFISVRSSGIEWVHLQRDIEWVKAS